MNITKSGISIAASAALHAFAAGGSTPAFAKDGGKEAAKVECFGVNGCHGQSDCKSAQHECKGQNECKGQGFKDLTAKECKAQGGTLKAGK
jgi:uncharacterized membrane protein